MSGYINFLSESTALIYKETLNHIRLVLISQMLGLVIAVPLGIVLSRCKKVSKYALALAGTVQTIPGLVLLGFGMIIFGIGAPSAIAVLTLYAILPMLRNTYTGIKEVDENSIESARGIGMNKAQILFKIELPLALPSIITGFRISTVYTVNWATLAGLVGAGGLGDLIWTGLATYENKFIITGAVLAAVMVTVFGALIGAAEKLLTPRGLKAGEV